MTKPKCIKLCVAAIICINSVMVGSQPQVKLPSIKAFLQWVLHSAVLKYRNRQQSWINTPSLIGICVRT